MPGRKREGDRGGAEVLQNDLIHTFDKPPCIWYYDVNKLMEVFI